MSKKVEMYKCDGCGHPYPTEYDAKRCEFEHQKLDFANYMLEQGANLGYIKYETATLHDLPDELKDVTKDTLFKISYLQCNDGYVYRVISIKYSGVEVQNSEDYYKATVKYTELVRGMEKK